MDLVAGVNRQLEDDGLDDRIAHLVMGVKEEHMVKKLSDKAGVSLCVNYPDMSTTGMGDTASDSQKAFFFLVEKVNPGAESDEAEIVRYGRLQSLMLRLRDMLRERYDSCSPFIFKDNYRIEWEYQIFGGFNGLSMSVDYMEVS